MKLPPLILPALPWEKNNDLADVIPETKIDALRREVAELKRQIATLEASTRGASTVSQEPRAPTLPRDPEQATIILSPEDV